MAAIAGIFSQNCDADVSKMLELIKYRGRGDIYIENVPGATLGCVSNGKKTAAGPGRVEDRINDYQYATAGAIGRKSFMERDPLGIVPLYYGRRSDGSICFASEVKGLAAITSDINEFPAGCHFSAGTFERYFELRQKPVLNEVSEVLAAELCRRLEAAVQSQIHSDEAACFLSGGLDSSLLAALVRRHVKKLRTFAAGMPDAPDLAYARMVADFIGSEHHEIIVGQEDILQALPEIIAHLESFDAPLVRSSVMHYAAAKHISRYAQETFSGEGADELFAGYAYLKDLSRDRLAGELIAITKVLSRTALQRVDRCGRAFGLDTHICFLDPAVIDLALQIPVELKLRDGVEKWILREAAVDLLPRPILERGKVKFWEGAGVQDILARHAASAITDTQFLQEKTLPNGWELTGKEELLYYRLFRERLGDLKNLDWMGRTGT
jgi:asparagine synthase (glutamine-hydrolysing)